MTKFVPCNVLNFFVYFLYFCTVWVWTLPICSWFRPWASSKVPEAWGQEVDDNLFFLLTSNLEKEVSG